MKTFPLFRLPLLRARSFLGAATLSGALVFVGAGDTALAASDPAPLGGDGTPAPVFPEVHFLAAEITWDYGDLGPDWRREITGEEPTENFFLRWKHSGPAFSSAALFVYNENDTFLGQLPLAVLPGVVDPAWRQQEFLLGDLPGPTPLTLRVRLFGESGQVGSASPEVQISAPTPPDPFRYTPLYLSGVITDTGVPGVAGGVWCRNAGNPREERFVGGVRRFNGGVGPAEGGDLWQWGSNTKAMVCTALAILIERRTPLGRSGRELDWDSLLVHIFPELSDVPAPNRALNTTLRHLACHRSGLHVVAASDFAGVPLFGTGAANATTVDSRETITTRLLTRAHFDPDDPATPTPPGAAWDYRNENYLVLGAVIDRVTGMSCEEFLQRELFGPLGMTSARFGLPVNAGPYQPHGHKRGAEYPFAINLTPAFLAAHAMDETVGEKWSVYSPAGAVSCSIADALKFCRLHLIGSEGSLTLAPATLDELHTPYPLAFPDDASYAWGWGVSNQGGKVLAHDGSVLTFYSRFSIHFGSGICAVSSANCGGKPEEGGSSSKGYGDTALNLFHTHLIEKATAKILPGGGASLAGSSTGGSGGSTGISDYTAPPFSSTPDNDDSALSEFEPLGPGFIPVSIHLSDRAHQRRAAAARAPRITTFERAKGPLFTLGFSTEKNLIYQVYGSPLLPIKAGTLVAEITAGSDATTLEIPRPEGAERYFYQVRELK